MSSPSSSPVSALVAAGNLRGFKLQLRDDKFSQVLVSEDNPMFMLGRIDRADVEVAARVIEIDGDEDHDDVVTDPIATLHSALGAMPSLKSFRLSGATRYRRGEQLAVVAVPSLTALLTSLSTTDTLRFVTVSQGLILRGSRADYLDLARVLTKQDHESKQPKGKKKAGNRKKWESLLSLEMSATLEVEEEHDNDDEVAPDGALDPVVKALATLPKLHYMEICQGGNLLQFASRQGIQSLCASPYISSLDLTVHGYDKAFDVVQALRSNPTVSRLKLAVHPSLTATTTAAVAVGEQRTGQALQEMLQHNRALLSLTLIVVDMQLEEETLILILQGLVQATLTAMDLQLPQSPPTYSERFQATARSLEKNVFLEDFSWKDTLRSRVEQLTPVFVQLELILKLNKAGRRFLVGNNSHGRISRGGDCNSTCVPSREQWMRTLTEVRDCLDSLFYLLTMNPEWVFATETLRPTQPIPSNKRTWDDLSAAAKEQNEVVSSRNKRRKVLPIMPKAQRTRVQGKILKSLDPLQRAFVEGILQENNELMAHVQRLQNAAAASAVPHRVASKP